MSPGAQRRNARPETRGVSVWLALAVAIGWCGVMMAEARGTEEPAALVASGDKAFARGDVVEAMRVYRAAAEAGFAPAQAKLGFILDQAEENSEAAVWFARSADGGSPDGRFGLGKLHLSGEGVPRDERKGLALMHEAAEGGSLLANLALARSYETGAPGIPRSPADALPFWRRAAALGERSAMARLASAHRLGELGLAADPEQARLWDEKARAVGEGR